MVYFSTLRNIKSLVSEIVTYQLPPKFIAHGVVPNSCMNYVIALDDDFQEPPLICVVDKGKTKVIAFVSPVKEKQKQI